MTTPALAETSHNGGRYYQWRGETFWSVTTLLGVINKPALPRWAAKLTAETAVEYAQTGLLERTITEAGPDAAIDLLKAAPWARTKEAQERGSAVHDHAERTVLGTAGDIPDKAAGFADQWVKWRDHYQPEFLASEMTVINRTHAYAGTLDAIVRIGDENWIIDYKTGKDIYPEVSLQLAAYRHAEFGAMPDGTEVELPEIHRAACLLLRPRSYRFEELDASEKSLRAFLHTREVYRWTLENDLRNGRACYLGPVQTLKEAA